MEMLSVYFRFVGVSYRECYGSEWKTIVEEFSIRSIISPLLMCIKLNTDVGRDDHQALVLPPVTASKRRKTFINRG